MNPDLPDAHRYAIALVEAQVKSDEGAILQLAEERDPKYLRLVAYSLGGMVASLLGEIYGSDVSKGLKHLRLLRDWNIGGFDAV